MSDLSPVSAVEALADRSHECRAQQGAFRRSGIAGATFHQAFAHPEILVLRSPTPKPPPRPLEGVRGQCKITFPA